MRKEKDAVQEWREFVMKNRDIFEKIARHLQKGKRQVS